MTDRVRGGRQGCLRVAAECAVARPAEPDPGMWSWPSTHRGLGCRRPGQGDGKGKAASRLISVASGSDLVRKRMAVQN